MEKGPRLPGILNIPEFVNPKGSVKEPFLCAVHRELPSLRGLRISQKRHRLV
jgi:hypothetical protein